MEIINRLLDRYKNLTPPERHIKEALVAAVFEVCGVKISKESISLNGTTAFIQAPSVAKSEIFEHQKHILAVAKNKVGEKFSISAIR